MSTLNADMMLRAYSCGLFPMAESADDPGIFLLDPDERGVLPLNAFHVSRSLKKVLRRDVFTVTWNQDFSGIVDGCAAPDKKRQTTWINASITKVFQELHEMGLAHSMECWQGSRLVGGLYGLSLGGVFFGESMFSRVPNASKVALCHLVAHLKRCHYLLLDVQFMSEHLAQFGAIEISREVYLRQLEKALKAHTLLPQGSLLGRDVVEALDGVSSQPRTQMS